MSKKHVLLTIGFSTYWLPSDAGVATLLKVMSSAQAVDKQGYGRDARLAPGDREYEGTVKVEYTDLKPVPKPEPPAKPKRLEASKRPNQRLLEFKP